MASHRDRVRVSAELTGILLQVNGCGVPAADRLVEIASVLATVHWR